MPLFSEPPLEWLMECSRDPNLTVLAAMGVPPLLLGFSNVYASLTEFAITRFFAAASVWTIAGATYMCKVSPRIFETCTLLAHLSWSQVMIWRFFWKFTDDYSEESPRWAFATPEGGIPGTLTLSQALLSFAGLRLVPKATCMVVNAVSAVIAIVLIKGPENFIWNTGSVIVWSVLFLFGAYVNQKRLKALHDTQRELAGEKESVQLLMTMVCDAGFWVAADCETILRSEPRFDSFMGAPMEGACIAEHVPDSERQRIRFAFEDTPAHVQSSVKLLPVTLLRARASPIRVDLFIVDQRMAFAPRDAAGKAKNSTNCQGRLGFLIGLRLNEPAGLLPPPPTIDYGEAQASIASPFGRTWAAARARSESEWSVDSQSAKICGARTYCSAPGVLEASPPLQFATGAVSCGGGGGDCLPPDATVWVEGKSMPTPLGKVQPGQKLLCYDHLCGGLKFTEVVDISRNPVEEAVDEADGGWVTVSLTDGTQLDMTADHPVFPELSTMESGASDAGCAVKARDLDPERHKLEILKVVPVPVKEVKPSARSSESMAVSVRQPGRHSLFVAPGANPTHGMAVASCSTSVRQPGDAWRGLVKNTFIDVPASGRGKRRTLTAPPGLWQAPHRKSLHDWSSCCTSDVAASLSASGGNSEDAILLGAVVAGREALGSSTACVRLSDIERLRRSGLRSIGSACHEEGLCLPCVMEHWCLKGRKHGEHPLQPCKYRELCGRCHEAHSEGQVKRAQRRMKLQAKGALQAEQSFAEGT